MVLLLPIGGPPLPTFSDPFISVTVLEPTIGSAGTTDWPASGAVAASGSYSSGLLALKGKLDASSWVPASLGGEIVGRDVEDVAESGLAGPLTVGAAVAPIAG